MLRQRVITALVLAPLALAAIFLFSPKYFSVFIGLVVVLASSEFVPLSGVKKVPWVVASGSALILLLIASYLFLPSLLAIPQLGALIWVGIVVMLIKQSRHIVSPLTSPSYITLAFGLVLLWFCWLSLSLLRMGSEQGSWLVMYLLLVIWAADIGAYFSGKRFGKNKLAVNLSPGKTLEGVAGGLLSVALLALIAHQWILTDLSLFNLLWISLLTAVVSVSGDLFESLLKRQRGMKDSGTLLPGHGGVLDRTDSLIAAAPVFYSLLWLVQK